MNNRRDRTLELHPPSSFSLGAGEALPLMSSPAIMRLVWVVESCNRVEAEWKLKKDRR